jgi:signal peptidase I
VSTATADTPAPKPVVDTRREIVETVVVVLALVSLLRSFVAEAFSIPTGSMGPTLLGANRRIDCPQCGHTSIVGAYAQAADPNVRLAGTICQNCRYPIYTEPRDLKAVYGEFGDRVIVSKYGYEFGKPKRWDVVVFIYPAKELPEQNSYPSRTNFIKRLVGLPGEEVAFMYGDAYVKAPGAKEFAIASKTPDVMLATRRVVFDNDEQPKDLIKIGFPPRWLAADGSAAKVSDDRTAFSLDGDGSLNYRHLIGGGHRDAYPHAMPKATAMTPQLVTDFEAYNQPFGAHRNQPTTGFQDLDYIDGKDMFAPQGASFNWVGDLMLECRLNLQALAGSFTIHLSEGKRKYRCEFSFDGEKKVRVYQGDKVLQEAANPIASAGSVDLRFANFDDRLVVWVNGRTAFGDGVPVAILEPEENGPTQGDLEPAKLSFTKLKGEVRGLKLYRDIYYTQESRRADEMQAVYPIGPRDEGSVAVWQKGLESSMSRIRSATMGDEPLRDGHKIFSIPTTHYMMCGDNSPRSYDGRGWSLTNFVPQECVLGKALVVYYPLAKLPWNLKLIQ